MPESVNGDTRAAREPVTGAWLGLPRRSVVPDLALALSLALSIAFISFQAGHLLDPKLTAGVWFEADSDRVYDNITDRSSNHYRTKVHPLFSLLLHPPIYAARHALGLDTATAVRLAVAAIASVWIVLLFAFLRAVGCHRLDAMVFTSLAGFSSASMFWTFEPESYVLGSITMLAALLVLAWTEHRPRSEWPFVLVSALTLSITITNWMAGLVATAVAFPWRRTAQITVKAFCVVVALGGVQKLLYPTAQFFLVDREEAQYMFPTEAGGPPAVLRAFAVHSMVMPDVQIVRANTVYFGRRLSVQSSGVGSGTRWGFAAAGLWLALLGLGCWALFTIRDQVRIRVALGLTIVGQVALHILYGEETFLYSMHFLPLLVAVAALGTLTRLRMLTLALGLSVVVLNLLNNVPQFERARQLLVEFEPGRNIVLDEMKRRPADPWPRGTGHVVLAMPGSQERRKAYHEPGGSFSPVPGSLGVSIWLVDQDHRVVLTSDAIPLNEIRQQFIGGSGRVIPDVLTETPYYQATWSWQMDGEWQLRVKQLGALRPLAVIRSVGPAGGRIDNIASSGQTVRVNQRWEVGMLPQPAAIHVGEEGTPGWMSDKSADMAWHASSGWGYARFDPSSEEWTLTVADIVDDGPLPEGPHPVPSPTPVLELPDTRFGESVNAQVAHLLMGLVDDETRPGEPMSYPLSWLRDGAYVIVALARSGQLETAKILVQYMAEHDFYGGFGAEADAPGLALWAIEEVAARAQDARFDAWLWPHVRRKAGWIEQLLSAKDPVDLAVTGPIVPSVANRPDLGRVADPAREGLIVGRMDFERPLLFVNAVSYRGLLDAAALADRSGHDDDGKRWRTNAAQLKTAWEKAFKPPESDNDRTFVTTLWPAGIGYGIEPRVRENLEQRWATRRNAEGDFRERPSWTYFDVAEAHQWLFAGEPDRVWTTLRWFWAHQASPGLFTWWERGQNAFPDWRAIRGWVAPSEITPHYWTAAEMLLLQLDMLAYEQPVSEPLLIIGAGVPPAWLKEPLRIERLSLRQGRLDWSWDGAEVHLRASWPVDASRVQLGPGFPAAARVRIERF